MWYVQSHLVCDKLASFIGFLPFLARFGHRGGFIMGREPFLCHLSPDGWNHPPTTGIACGFLSSNKSHAGIIPACAGSTPSRYQRPKGAWDHPRMRGEHKDVPGDVSAQKGSSPHARGALAADGDTELVLRIIPACAGSTVQKQSVDRLSGDHPRMRGEHDGLAQKLGGDGIIPACAGSTCLAKSMHVCAGDHPRMRGEHLKMYRTTSAFSGSSPHARGAPQLVEHRPVVRGIIPACAGSTSCQSRSGWPCWDHPRMRGEHRFSLVITRRSAGSSPHARGALGFHQKRLRAHGIIPACAGSTT